MSMASAARAIVVALTLLWVGSPRGAGSWARRASGACLPVTQGSRFVVLFAVTLMAFEAAAQSVSAEISGYDSAYGTSAERLGRMVQQIVSGAPKKLFVLAQCYGGDVVPSLAGLPKTVVLSGTSSGQEGGYGGYHDDAARALRAGGGTARNVHTMGTMGKMDYFPPGTDEAAIYNEMPIEDGTIAPEDFPLDPVTPGGVVEGRVVIVYAGKPDEKVESVDFLPGGVTKPKLSPPTKVLFRDVDDRQRIRINFNDGSTVITVGGAPAPDNPSVGQDGWDLPGTQQGLLAAMMMANALITAAPNPSKWQLVVYVTDHGRGTRKKSLVTPAVAAGNSRSVVVTGFKSFEPEDPRLVSMARDPENQPGFTVTVDRSAAPPIPLAPDGSLGFGPVDLEITPLGMHPLVLPLASARGFDLNLDGMVGGVSGEEIDLVFFVPEPLLLGPPLLGATFDVALLNGTPETLLVKSVDLSTGSIARGAGSAGEPTTEAVPIGPAAVVLMALLLGVIGVGALHGSASRLP